MLKGTGTTPGAIRSEDAAILEKLGITPERIIRELVKIAYPDLDVCHLVPEEAKAAARESLSRIRLPPKPEVEKPEVVQ